MKNKLIKGRLSKNKIISLIGIVGIILVLVLNLLLTNLSQNKTLFVDTTYEGLYTLTDLMKEECKFVDELDGGEVKITFCADPDTLMSSVTTRVVYFMAL